MSPTRHQGDLAAAYFRACRVALVGAVLLVVGCSERPVSEYPTFRAAERAGAVERGWIPASLPVSAHALWEQHDLDTNQVFLRFELPASERPSLLDALSLRALSDEEIRTLQTPQPWSHAVWFEALVQKAPANDGALDARVYAASGAVPTTFVAVDRTSDAVYLWTVPD